MRSWATQLLVLTLVAAVHLIHANSFPTFVTEACPDATEVYKSSSYRDENETIRQTFACPNGQANITVLSGGTRATPIQHLSPLQARSQAECTTPETECQCGTSVACGCIFHGTAPLASDCSTLLISTSVIASTEGPTFMVERGNFHVITLGSCSLGFLNTEDFTEEFCWDDLETQGSSVTNCLMGGLTSGYCLSNNHRYLTRLGHSDDD